MFDQNESRKVIQTAFGCKPEDISSHVFLTLFARKKDFEDLFPHGMIEYFGWWKTITGKIDSQKVTVIVPGVGPSVAGDCVILLKYTPCRVLVYTGFVGSLNDEHRVGDLIIPMKAYIGECFSRYHGGKRISYPDEKLSRFFVDCLQTSQNNYKVHIGKIFTIESITGETADFLLRLKQRHIDCIDMETSAIFTASCQNNIRCCAVHCISDFPLKEHILLTNSRMNMFDPFRNVIKLVIRTLLKLTTDL